MKTDQKILDVACRLFHKRGFDAVSIDEIGKAVGVSGPAIYRHFRSKAEVLAVLCNLTIDRLIEFVGPCRPDPESEIEALLRGQARFVIRYPELLLMALGEERALKEPWRRQFRRRQREHVQRWIAALSVLYPEEDPTNLEMCTYAAIGLLLSAPRWPRSVRSVSDFEDRLVTLARHALNITGVEK